MHYQFNCSVFIKHILCGPHQCKMYDVHVLHACMVSLFYYLKCKKFIYVLKSKFCEEVNKNIFHSVCLKVRSNRSSRGRDYKSDETYFGSIIECVKSFLFYFIVTMRTKERKLISKAWQIRFHI